MAKDNIKRFPRPMGTTAMAAEYQRVRILKIYKRYTTTLSITG